MADGFSNLTKRMLEDREAQAAEFERQQKVLEGMKKQLEESGMQAEDNKEYNKRKEKLDKKQYKFRLKGATSPSARKKIKQDEKARQKKEQGLLGKIAKSTSGMFGNMKQRIKGAGKGIMNMLKGTLVAGVLLAVVAFLESPYWEKLKGFIVDTVVPALKKIWEWLKLLFSDPVQALKDLFFGLLEGAKTLGKWLWNKAILPFWDWIVTVFKETDWGALWDSLWDKAASIGKWLWNKAIKPFWDWAVGIFKETDWGALWDTLWDKATSIGKWLWNKAIKPFWDWISGIFVTGFDKLWTGLFGAVTSIGAWIWDKSIKPFWDWIKGIFSSEEPTDWGKLWKDLVGACASVMEIIWSPVKNGIAWVLRLFGWDEAAAATEKFSISGFIIKVFDLIKCWFVDLFTFDGTKAGIAAGILNIAYFLPNLVIKGVMAAGEWLLRLFGFDESADAVGKAAEGFSIGKMVVCAAIAAWDWLKEKLSFKIPSLNLPDIGLELKARAAGMVAYAKAALIPFKSSSEAYTEAYNSVVGGGQPPDVAEYTPDEPPLSVKEQQEEWEKEKANMTVEELRAVTAAGVPAQMQHGGAFSGLSPFIAGENGRPELILPTGPGQVINGQRTAAMQNAALQRRMDGMGGGDAQAIIAPTTVANTQSTNITNTSTTLVNNDPIVSTVNKAA